MATKKAIEWTDDLLLGDTLIDAQHRAFFQKALRVQVAIQLGRGNEEIAAAIDFMREYAAVHFADEAKRMLAADYPQIESHIAEHHLFLGRLRELEEEFDSSTDSKEVAARTVALATEWFAEHIRRTDQPLAAFLGDIGS